MSEDSKSGYSRKFDKAEIGINYDPTLPLSQPQEWSMCNQCRDSGRTGFVREMDPRVPGLPVTSRLIRCSRCNPGEDEPITPLAITFPATGILDDFDFRRRRLLERDVNFLSIDIQQDIVQGEDSPETTQQKLMKCLADLVAWYYWCDEMESNKDRLDHGWSDGSLEQDW